MREEHPLRIHPFFQWLGRVGFRLAGWRVEGRFPDVPKVVAVVAYHTAQRDFPLGLFCSFILGIKASWIGKHTLFRPPMGWFMRAFGGIPVDRRHAHGTVNEIARIIKERPYILLGISPEGTRARTEYWRSGFYRIALAANVPIVLCYLDFKRKVAGIAEELLYPSGDKESDLEKIRAFYAGVTACYPERVGPIRFRD